MNITLPMLTEDQICTELLADLSEQVSNCEFGIFKGQNATKENSYYTINNGRNVKGKFNSYETFNGQTSLPENWWKRIGPTPAANKSGITGTLKILLLNIKFLISKVKILTWCILPFGQTKNYHR